MLKSNISLVRKNDSWVPKKEQQLPIIEKHGYTLIKTLGEGAYAKVKLANSKRHNCQVAVKVINKRRAPKDFLKKFLPREVHLMHRLNHPNVIKLYEVVETSTKVYLIMQLATKGDLLEYINSRPMLSEDEVRLLFCQLAAAMAFCHKEHVVHRDLKCENILIGGDDKLKVTDFGFAISTIKNRLLETFCGSYAYCCPQILRGEPYDGTKADVWSMGVVLYAMGCARLPFSEKDMQALTNQDFTNKIKFSKRVSKEYRDLVRWMLNANQDERASAEQVFRSPWCMKAIKDNPELSYLQEHVSQVLVRKPSECAPPETDEFEEETYPVDVKQVHAKIGEKSSRGMVTCFTFAAPTYVPKQTKTVRRHTISGYEIHDKSHRPSLRDDLLRSLAQKEIRSRSLQKIDEGEKKALPEESFNRQKSKRRSSLVTDIITAVVSAPSEHTPGQSRVSLVSDVIKSASRRSSLAGSQKNWITSLHKQVESVNSCASRRSSLAGSQKNWITSVHKQVESVNSCASRRSSLAGSQKNWITSLHKQLEIVKSCKTDSRERVGPGGRESRLKEVAQLKYTSAARAAKMAYQEAHIAMEANRGLYIAFKCAPHYSTIPGVERLSDYQHKTNSVEKNASAKFKDWQKKFKIGLIPTTSDF